MNLPQQEFDTKYISSREILKRLQISRTAICLAHKRKKLPPPIVVNNNLILLWVRAEVEPLISSWKLELDTKRLK